MPVYNQLNRCYHLSLSHELIQPDLAKMLLKYGNQKGLSFESLFSGFLTVCSSICSRTRVNVSSDLDESLSLYTVLIEAVTSRRSFCVNLLNDSLGNASCLIDECENIGMQSSHLKKSNDLITNAVQLLESLSRTDPSAAIILWDNSFYLNSVYEPTELKFKSLITELYNCDLNEMKYYAGSLKFVLKKPTLSVLCVENSLKMIDILQEKSMNSFYSKFFICCPKPAKKSLDAEIPQTELDFDKCFFVLKMLNNAQSKSNELDFDGLQSLDELNKYFEAYNNLCATHQVIDPFLGEIFAQASVQLLRLIGVLQLAENAIEIINKAYSMTNAFSYGNLFNLLKTRKDDSQLRNKISLGVVNRGFHINNYFLLNKIYLAGYDLDLNELKTYPSISKFNSFLTDSTVILLNDSIRLLDTPILDSTLNHTPVEEIDIIEKQDIREVAVNQSPAKSILDSTQRHTPVEETRIENKTMVEQESLKTKESSRIKTQLKMTASQTPAKLGISKTFNEGLKHKLITVKPKAATSLTYSSKNKNQSQAIDGFHLKSESNEKKEETKETANQEEPTINPSFPPKMSLYNSKTYNESSLNVKEKLNLPNKPKSTLSINYLNKNRNNHQTRQPIEAVQKSEPAPSVHENKPLEETIVNTEKPRIPFRNSKTFNENSLNEKLKLNAKPKATTTLNLNKNEMINKPTIDFKSEKKEHQSDEKSNEFMN